MDIAVPTTDRLRLRLSSARVTRVAAATGVAALVATSALLGAVGDAQDATLNALLRASMVGAPLAAGLYAWHLRPYTRFARLLVAVGLVSFITTLAETSNATLYSVGRTAGWGVEVLLVLLLLAFPHGRLPDTADRRLARATLAVVAVFFLPTLVLADGFRVASPYTSCTHDCPANVFFRLDRQPGFVDPLMRGLGSALVFALLLAVLVRLQQRMATARPPERQMLGPVLAVGMARATVMGVALVGRDLGDATTLARAGSWMIAWATPLIAVAFLVGLVRARLYSERALRALARCVADTPEVAALQRALADALDDPDVQIALPRDGLQDGWVDGRRRPVKTPLEADPDVELVYGRNGTVVAALTGVTALKDRPELLEAAAGLVAAAMDRLRLVAEAQAAALEAQRSRARMAATADRERRRIERDLHDGAQQRLVAVRIELGLVEDLVRRDPDRCAQRLQELECALDDALEDLRSLAHGVCPPLLADRGLVEALRAAIGRSPVPGRLETESVGRYAPEIESAVYFCVLEALQNVAKHAAGARRVVVRLDGDARGELHFAVRDDGPGAAQVDLQGAGVTNMRDRVVTLGGELTIRTAPGLGTEVRGFVPVPVAAAVSAGSP